MTSHSAGVDWGLGCYERTATDLEPAAETVVELARVRPGERVLDVGCGTGNAALLAARRGADVAGVDLAERLVAVARARAAAEGLGASFAVGDAQALPFPGGSFDAVLSVFGVVFAADARTAFAEIVRVLRPGGRALLSAWEPRGAIDAMVGVLARAAAAATGARPQRFPWHDRSAVTELAAAHGVGATFHEAAVTFRDASPERYFAAQEEHPMSVALRPLLERSGSWAAAREEALAALRAGNEDPAGFRVTAPYVVIELARGDER